MHSRRTCEKGVVLWMKLNDAYESWINKIGSHRLTHAVHSLYMWISILAPCAASIVCGWWSLVHVSLFSISIRDSTTHRMRVGLFIILNFVATQKLNASIKEIGDPQQQNNKESNKALTSAIAFHANNTLQKWQKTQFNFAQISGELRRNCIFSRFFSFGRLIEAQ